MTCFIEEHGEINVPFSQETDTPADVYARAFKQIYGTDIPPDPDNKYRYFIGFRPEDCRWNETPESLMKQGKGVLFRELRTA